jgi:hypothetical protein
MTVMGGLAVFGSRATDWSLHRNFDYRPPCVAKDAFSLQFERMFDQDFSGIVRVFVTGVINDRNPGARLIPDEMEALLVDVIRI